MSEQVTSQPSGRLIVGFTGRIGAGKTSAARYLAGQHGFGYVRYSQVLSEWKAEQSTTKAALQAAGWDVMAGGEQTELNRRVIARIPEAGNCAVDGLRHPLDYQSLCDRFGQDFHLVYVYASQEIRWKRHANSGRFNSIEHFRATDEHPVEQRIEELRTLSDIALNNEAQLEDLYRQIDEALTHFRKGVQQ